MDQAVPVGRLGEPGQPVQVVRTVHLGQRQVAQIAEVVLEPAGRDHLDDAAGLVAGVPPGVHLPAWFGDVAAGSEHDRSMLPADPTRLFPAAAGIPCVRAPE
ncbi:hypothetical protein [Lentzea aerocolonigenes]|uniref:hypothetical protein n=1 Tax=Lentzea aerocolonigenes TaxID=68170 RepID=UPI0012E2D146|nr:hypothetical protein [Lentzea aerocolonigenes]